MSGFTSKDIPTIVLKSVHPSLLDFHFPFAWYFLKEFHSLCVRIVSKIMKGIFTGFKSLNPVIFNRLKKEKHHTRYHFTLLKVPWSLERRLTSIRPVDYAARASHAMKIWMQVGWLAPVLWALFIGLEILYNSAWSCLEKKLGLLGSISK